MIQVSLYEIVFTSSEVRRQVKKTPEGGFVVSWWPGAESNQSRGCLTLMKITNYGQLLAVSGIRYCALSSTLKYPVSPLEPE
jgi:hypothetical protein